MQRNIRPPAYIVANKRNGISQHRDGFTKRYGCKLLVWYELHATMEYAITREKQLKAGSRARKLALIEASNPQWRDFWLEITR